MGRPGRRMHARLEIRRDRTPAPAEDVGLLFLLELLLVILIIGLAVMFAVPSYRLYLERSQAAETLGLLGGARSEALLHYSWKGKWPTLTELVASESSFREARYSRDLRMEDGVLSASVLLPRRPGHPETTRIALRPILSPRETPKMVRWLCTRGEELPRGAPAQANPSRLGPEWRPFICRLHGKADEV